MSEKNQISVYTSKVSVSKETVSIKFPKKILEYLRLQGPNIRWVPVNGTIQLIVATQEISVPLMPIEKDAFLAQS